MLALPGKRIMKRSILLIDGSPLMRNSVGQRLRAAGYIVHGAADVSEASELLEGVNIDLAVLEPSLARGGGLELLRRIRADALFKILPVIIYTHDDDPAIARQAAKLKADGVLHKDRDGFEALLTSI